ncbi:MAG: hypothetical protein EBR81_09845 [Proteobacteria bacterium]|nr:hypothetical protein [Pseudomonadota bacterium]
MRPHVFHSMRPHSRIGVGKGHGCIGAIGAFARLGPKSLLSFSMNSVELEVGWDHFRTPAKALPV